MPTGDRVPRVMLSPSASPVGTDAPPGAAGVAARVWPLAAHGRGSGLPRARRCPWVGTRTRVGTRCCPRLPAAGRDIPSPPLLGPAAPSPHPAQPHHPNPHPGRRVNKPRLVPPRPCSQIHTGTGPSLEGHLRSCQGRAGARGHPGRTRTRAEPARLGSTKHSWHFPLPPQVRCSPQARCHPRTLTSSSSPVGRPSASPAPVSPSRAGSCIWAISAPPSSLSQRQQPVLKLSWGGGAADGGSLGRVGWKNKV